MVDVSRFKGKFPDLHVHTGEGSLRDTGSLTADLVKRETELGATAMAITDHGTLTATQSLRAACEGTEIKPIYGCEFYVDIGDGDRTHFVVLAKNLDGYQAISKVCTATAYNMHDGRPIATLDMFKEWFSEGHIGYGNAVATSACMQGPLCRKILQNSVYDTKISKIESKRKKETSPEDAVYQEAMRQLNALNEELSVLKAEREEVFALAKKTYKKELNHALRSGDEEEIHQARTLQAQIEAAIAEKPKAKNRETKKANEVKKLKEVIAPMVKSVEKYQRYSEEIQELENNKVSKEKAVEDTVDMLHELIDIFGKDNFYIELQNHGIDEEIYAMPIIAQIARENDIPVIATNDVHYATRDRAEARQYNFVQFYGWSEMRPQDEELYIKTNEELAEWLCRILPDDVVLEAIENTYKVAEMCNVEFAPDKHYPKFPCKEGAKLHLRRLIISGKSKIAEWTPVYQKRVERELKVIETMGFSDYLCIVADFLNYARLVGKIDLKDPRFLADPFNMVLLKELAEGKVGEGCGPGRGSAAGSLICYLVGITNIDPIKDDLLFERFLNPERVSMPEKSGVSCELYYSQVCR